MKKVFAAFLVLAAIAVMGCKSGSILVLGENTVVRYQQFDRDSGEITLELVLVEESHAAYKNLYNEQRNDGKTKLIPDDRFSVLIQTLEDLDYVEMAQPRALGAVPRLSAASKAIVVESDRGQWIANNSEDGLTAEQRPDFYLMERMLLNVYDSVLSLQVITNEDGKDLFLQEQRRLQEENKRLEHNKKSLESQGSTK